MPLRCRHIRFNVIQEVKINDTINFSPCSVRSTAAALFRAVYKLKEKVVM